MLGKIQNCAVNFVKFYVKCEDSQGKATNLLAALMMPTAFVIIEVIAIIITIDTWYDFHTGGIE